MKISNTCEIDAPITETWSLLDDIAGLAPCIPGVKLTGEDAGVYQGHIKVKVGPLSVQYAGNAQFLERDEAAHTGVLEGKGRDSRGAGNIAAKLTFKMHDKGDKTQVDIETDLQITGKVAQFGRGVIQDVSAKLLDQFLECLGTKLEGSSALEQIAAASANDSAGAAEASSDSAGAVETGSAEDSALDIVGLARGAILRRFLPVALAIALVVVLLVLLT